MNKLFVNGLFILAVGATVVSCADYNDIDDFKAAPDPTFVEPYKDLAPVKSYIDRAKYPNMALGATLKVSDFNLQALAHAAAMTNFDDLAFGNTLMSGTIINGKGVMNFLDMMDLLDHVEEIGAEVHGSPIVANANQPDEWLNTLTAPIEIPVDFVEGKTVNYNDSTTFNGTVEKGKVSIAQRDGQNWLKIEAGLVPGIARVVEGFEVDPKAKYTTTLWILSEKDASFFVHFSGNKIAGTGTSDGKWTLKAGKLTKVVVEAQSAPDITEGYLTIENTRSSVLYVQKVEVGYYPDNHRPQTAKELNDTINFALKTWCDGMMKINDGRIKVFDLIDEAIDANAEMENGKYDLKHSADQYFWQDALGSENYAPEVSKIAAAAFEKYGGNPSELRFFISESGLDEQKKFESLMYWIDIWEKKGAKIDGINAKLNLSYSENAEKQAANEAMLNRLLQNLASTGKQIRLSSFDIKYQDANGASVTAANITAEQRQKLADYYGYAIKAYVNTIPADKQAGLCKGSMVDTNDPVGLWSVDSKTKDWVRNATYKAFCDALSGK